MEANPLKLLTIDDRQDLLTALEAIVRHALPECTLLTVSNGPDVVEMAQSEDPDVILLDIGTPSGDAFAVCRKLKADDRLQAIPVVFLASPSRDSVRRFEALEAGGEGFLSKPIDEVELVAQVRAMAKLKATNRLCRWEKEQLTASHRQVRDVLESISDAFFSLDDNLVVTYFNAAAERMLHRPSSEVLGRPLFESFPEARGSVFEQKYRQALRERQTLSFEVEFSIEPYANWYEVRVYPQAQGISVYFQVVTDRKRAEVALRESEQRQRAILDTIPDPAWLKDKEGRFLAVNAAWCRFFGMDAASALGRTQFDLLPAEVAARFAEQDRAVMLSLQPLQEEELLTSKDGRLVWFETVKSPLVDCQGDVFGVSGIAREITPRKKAEEELRQSEERHRTILQTAMDGFVLVDMQGRLLEVNAAYCRMSGYSEQELLGKSISDMEAAETAAVTAAHMQQVVQQGEDRFESCHRRKDGSTCAVEVSVQYSSTAGGRYISFLRDITERKLADETLRQSEGRFRAIIEASPLPLAINDEQGKVLYVNAAFVRTIGYTLSDIPTLADWWPRAYPDPQYRQWASDAWQQNLEAARRSNQPFASTEVAIRCKDDSTRTFVVSGAALQEGSVGPHLVVLCDITEIKRAEDTLNATLSKLDATLNALPDILFEVDETGRFYGYRPPRLDNLYALPQAFLGRTVSEVLPPESAAVIMDAIREAAANGTSFGHSYSLSLPDGPHWFELSIAVQAPGASTGKRLVVLARDITERKLADDSLRESEARLRSITEAAQDAILIMNPAGQVSYWNPAAERIFGYTSAEAIGQVLHTLIVPARYREAHYAALPAFQRTGAGPAMGQTLDLQSQRKDGQEIAVQLSLSAIQLDGAWHAVGILRDITERKRAEAARNEALARFSGFAEASQYGMGMADLGGRIVYVNPKLVLTLGETRAEDCLGRHFPTAYYSPLMAHKLQEEVLPALLREGHWHGELALRTVDGRDVPTDENYFVIRDEHGQPCYLAVILTDITERRQFQQSLASAKDAAETSNRAKSEFLANMSHEIRTPMAAILGFSELLNAGDLSPTEQSNFIALIQDNGKALLGIINDILDLSRIEADRLPLKMADCPLQSIVDEALALSNLVAAKKGLSLQVAYTLPVLATIYTDAARLRQILVNLVGNAVKFTERGEVRLTVRCVQADDGTARVQFAVSDTGIGIPPDKLDEIFQPFIQVDGSHTRRYGGTGLGLSISQRLAQALHGRIEVTSELGRGSTFTLTIDGGPWPKPPTGDASREQATVQTTGTVLAREPVPTLHGRILLVEDEPDLQVVVRHLLRRQNLEVEVAGDGQLGCQMADQSRSEGRPYALILMDLQLPRMDGLAATRLLRSQGWSAPIVALTAHAMAGDRDRCLAAGCDDYVSKPISPSELREILRRHLS